MELIIIYTISVEGHALPLPYFSKESRSTMPKSHFLPVKIFVSSVVHTHMHAHTHPRALHPDK